MSFNGSGTFSPLAASYPAVTGTVIDSTKHNNLISDIASGLSNCVTKDGQTTITANLPMATYRHTGVGDASALTDYASANQVVDNALTFGGTNATGTDAYAVSLPISPGAYAAGLRVQFITDVANTGACTLNVNSLGATSIVLLDGGSPATGQIKAGHVVDVLYDGTNWVLLNPVEVLSGTWTPELSDSSSSVTSASQTYAAQNGVYRVIDDLVFIVGDLAMTSIGSLSGDAYIHNLPFTTATSPTGNSALTFGYYNLDSAVSAGYSLIGDIAPSETVIDLWINDAAGGLTRATCAEVGATGSMYFTATYIKSP